MLVPAPDILMFDCIPVVVWHVGLRNIYMREAEGMCSPVIGGFSRDLNARKWVLLSLGLLLEKVTCYPLGLVCISNV